MNKQVLKDVQNSEDIRGVDIQNVGIKNIKVPLIVQRKNAENQTVSANAQVSVSLPSNFRGTHMSRFIEILSEWGQKHILGTNIKSCLQEIASKLDAKSSYLKFDFTYFIKKEAPISRLSCPMDYSASFEGILDENNYEFILGIKIPVMTLCPCSKEISDFGAHNQRAIVNIRISYDEESIIWLEDLVELADRCASSPVYPLLKREDEKFVTEEAYNNPKFVEDLLRDVVLELRKIDSIKWFEVDCEAFESIHNHSAWASQKEILKY